MHSQPNRPVEFSFHALQRARQMGYTEDQLRDALLMARKTNKSRLNRVYETGGLRFFCALHPERVVVKTVWDDNHPRNPYV